MLTDMFLNVNAATEGYAGVLVGSVRGGEVPGPGAENFAIPAGSPLVATRARRCRLKCLRLVLGSRKSVV